MILLAFSGSHVTRGEPFTIGSKKAGRAEVLLDDRYVSDIHARVWPESGSWWLLDMGSTNGTWRADGRERLRSLVLLGKGDKLRFGRTIVTFVPDEVDTSHPEAVAFE